MPHAVERHFLLACIRKPLLIQPIHNGRNRLAAVIFLESFQYKRRGQRVDLEVLLCVDHIADGHRSAVEFALERVVRHAANDLFRKVGRVIFCVALQHRFEDDALRAVGNYLRCRYDFHAVFLELGFVSCTVVTVSCEPVQLPDDHHIEQALAAVLDHILKLRTVVGLGRIRAVDVMPQNCDAVLFGKSGTLAKLTFNRFFSLAVRGIAGVNHGFHFVSTSESICTSVPFNRSFMAEPGSKHISTNRAISGLFNPMLTWFSYAAPLGLSVLPKM